jgi:xanthine/uracil permease
MDNQSINQQPKYNPKWKAYTSLILGLFGLIITIMFTFFIRYFYYGFIVLFGVFTSSILGLVLGVGGLYSTKRILAVLGLIMCLSAIVLMYWRFW